MPGGLSRGPWLLRLPGNLFRYVRLQAAEGQPRQISESLGEFLSGPLEFVAGRFGYALRVSDPRRSCLSRRQLVVSMLFGIQLAVAAILNFTENLRYRLHLHGDDQCAIRKQQPDLPQTHF
jgi:hypothetical protein